MIARMKEVVLLVVLSSSALIAQWEPPYPSHSAKEADTSYNPWYRYPVEGFVFPTSVTQGETIQLYVSLNQSGYTSYYIDVYDLKDTSATAIPRMTRQGQFFSLHYISGTDTLPLFNRLHKPVEYRTGCKRFWEPGRVNISTSGLGHQGGMYFIRLTIVGEPTGFQYDIPVVVKASVHSAPILVNFPINTYQAYNYWGGASLYTTHLDSIDNARGFVYDSTITMDRPLAQHQVRGLTHYSPLLWFMELARDSGDGLEFCDNRDLDYDGEPNVGNHELVSNYKMYATIGHDEYWSRFERDDIEKWFKSDQGRNLMVLGANTCFWRISWLDNERRMMKCRKHLGGVYTEGYSDRWRDALETPEPEAWFLGSQYETGVNPPPEFINPPMKIRNAAHWMFRGTGLQNGNLVGRAGPDPNLGIVGDEIDNTVTGGAIQFLAAVDTVAQQDSVRSLGPNGIIHIKHQAVYHEDTTSNARIFNAGTIYWSRGLSYQCHPDDIPKMRTITANLLDHFSGKKYIGKVWTSDPERALEWHSNIELDGGVEIPQGKYLRVFSPTVVTIDSGVILSIDGTLEINGNVTIIGPGQITVGATGQILLNNGATLTIKCRLNMAPGVVLNVPSNTTLRIQTPAQVYFGDYAGLVVDGTLHAQGSQAQHVSFSPYTTGQQWAGIYSSGQTSGSTIFMEYVDISHVSGAAVHAGNTVNFAMIGGSIDDAATGIEIVPGSSFSLPTIQLTDITMTNIGTGLYLDGSSNVNFDHSHLYGKGDGNGIVFVGSSPILQLNVIKQFYYGMLCIDGSAPMLDEYQSGANNVITENTEGVYCQDVSNPNLGAITPPGYDAGGQNSIFNNAEYDVVIEGDNLTVVAQNNWWGSRDDPPGNFKIGGNSILSYYPYLYSDPNPGARPTQGNGKNVFATMGDEGGNGTTIQTLPTLMMEAIRERRAGNFTQAVVLLKAIVVSAAMPAYAKHWAIGQLLAVAQRMPQPALASYLASLASSQPALAKTAKALLPFSHWREGSPAQAMAAFAANIQQYPNSELACAGVYGKFVYALYNANDTTQARSLVNQLHAGFPRSPQTQLAEMQMRSVRHYTNSPVAGGANKLVSNTTQSGASLPTEFRLSQNYPNPFNPSTTINFALPKDSHVSLKLYDLLGREVQSLVDESLTAGYHHVTLDGSSLATGVYLYRMTAERFTASKKLLLVK